MRCSNCDYFNDSKAQYCLNCGSLLSSTNKESILRSGTQRTTTTNSQDQLISKRSTVTKNEDQISINNLLLVLGTIIATSLIWFFFNVLNSRFEFLSDLSWYRVLNYFTEGVTLLVILIASVRVTNNIVRNFLLIYFFIMLFITIGYQFINY